MSRPLEVEIIAYAPTAFYHCTHCEVAWREWGVTNQIHDEQVRSSLPSDLAHTYQELSNWVRKILQRHCDEVLIKVIDAASIEGFIKSLRYRVRKYPAIIIDRETIISGGDFEAAGVEISGRLGEPERSGLESLRSGDMKGGAEN